MTKFSDLPLPPVLQRALQAMKFETATPIQDAAFPVAFAGKDLIGCAETGTGKTGAFSIPMLKVLLEERASGGLVLAPTRELAEQIAAVWRELTRFSPEIRTALLIGGASMPGQLRQLAKSPRLVIATPGRLLDHLRQRSISLQNVRFLVLDEADRMLDMGFAPQLNEILRHLPRERQNFLFTATWDKALDHLAKRFTNNAEQITIGVSSQAARTVAQEYVHVSNSSKNEALLDELNHRPGSTLVFTRTQIRTDKVARYLERYGVSVGRIHGGRSQAQRSSALAAFRSGKTRVLVATDIAARGIDVAEIANVINFDLPRSPEDYIHRIGRTGRNGENGVSLSFLTNEDRSTWNQILKLLRKSQSPLPTEVEPAKLIKPAEPREEASAETVTEAAEVLNRLEALPDFESEEDNEIPEKRVQFEPPRRQRSAESRPSDRRRRGFTAEKRAFSKARPKPSDKRGRRGLDERRFGFRPESGPNRGEFRGEQGGFGGERRKEFRGERQKPVFGTFSAKASRAKKERWPREQLARRDRRGGEQRAMVPGKRPFAVKPRSTRPSAPLGIVRR